ncbi:hypothetical protein B0J11DRAFT_581449 [Dendryphion nanum]|uniref:Uncharacterized protein n=1 Tax=Dendryphion nanum TaxID=256645 RepID=A0A9P9DP89_9PLEO|nr:hypothetical protein B0J11DRAFT_581449 [Dendryphion nanum]
MDNNNKARLSHSNTQTMDKDSSRRTWQDRQRERVDKLYARLGVKQGKNYAIKPQPTSNKTDDMPATIVKSRTRSRLSTLKKKVLTKLPMVAHVRRDQASKENGSPQDESKGAIVAQTCSEQSCEETDTHHDETIVPMVAQASPDQNSSNEDNCRDASELPMVSQAFPGQNSTNEQSRLGNPEIVTPIPTIIPIEVMYKVTCADNPETSDTVDSEGVGDLEIVSVTTEETVIPSTFGSHAGSLADNHAAVKIHCEIAVKVKAISSEPEATGEELKAVEGESSEPEQKSMCLENIQAELEWNLLELKEQCSDLTLDNLGLNKHRLDLEHQLSEKDNEIAQLKARLDEQYDQQYVERSENDELKTDIARIQDELKAADLKEVGFQQKLDKALKDIEGWRRNHRGHLKTKKDLKVEIKDLTNRLDEQQEEKEALELTAQDLQDHADNLNKTITETRIFYENRIEEHIRGTQAMEQQIQELIAEISARKTHTGIAHSKLVDKIEQQQGLMEDMAAWLKLGKPSTFEQVQCFFDEVHKRDEKIKALEDEVAVTKQHLAASLSEIDEIRTVRDRSAKRESEHFAKVDGLMEEKEFFEARSKSALATIAFMRLEFKGLSAGMSEIQASSPALDAAIEIPFLASNACIRLADVVTAKMSLEEDLKTSKDELSKLTQILFTHRMEERSRQAALAQAQLEARTAQQNMELYKYSADTLLENPELIGENRDLMLRLQAGSDSIMRSALTNAELQGRIGYLQQTLHNIGDWYVDQTINIVPALHKKIAGLMAEKGEDYIVPAQEHPNPNVDIKMLLRQAIMAGAWDQELPNDLVPFNPTHNPGRIPATYERVKALLPLGWEVLYNVDKVFMKPMFEQFTGQDSQERAEAGRQAEHEYYCAQLGFDENQYHTVLHTTVNEETGEAVIELEIEMGEDTETKQIDIITECTDDEIDYDKY